MTTHRIRITEGGRARRPDSPSIYEFPLEFFTGVANGVILRPSIWGVRLRWAARADSEPTATEGGDPSGTFKRWFDRASRRAGR
jgi:hypothetical protein